MKSFVLALAIVAASSAAPSIARPLGAQGVPQGVPQGADPVDDLILRVIADLNDLRYDDAIARGREVFRSAATMTPAQEALLRTALAAAFYPEEEPAQRPDSALAQFAAAIRVKPDVVLPVELRWSGLDSLLDVARSRVFAVVVQADSPRVLAGPDARGGLMVQSSRPARFTLRTGLVGSSTSVVQSTSSEPSTASVLMFRALDGRDVLLAPGAYTATITAVDAAGDSVQLRRRLLVEGQPLFIVAPPVFDSTRLLPERRRGSLARRALISAVLGGTAFYVASLFKDAEFDGDFRPSGASVGLGLSVFAIGVSTHWIFGAGRDADAVAANARLREEHRRAVERAEEESAARRNAYRVTVTLAP